MKGKKLLISSIVVSITLALGITLWAVTRNKLKEEVTIEAGSKVLEVGQFLLDAKDQGEFVTDLNTINLNHVGNYKVKIKVGNKVYNSHIKIVDTTAPVGTPVNKEIWNDETLNPNELVTDIKDSSTVTVTFKETPDFTKVGEQNVILLLTDPLHNTSEVTTKVTVKVDTTAPVITGAKDFEVFQEAKVSYRKDVVVTDNKDQSVTLDIDSSAVNLKKIGKYNVIYSATDSSGNTTTQTIVLTVKEKPLETITQEQLNQYVDQVLKTIIKPGMDDVDQMWAIYKYTRRHIYYTGFSDKSDWMMEAYRGIKNAKGDCFTYYSVSKALLTRAGFENKMVKRIDGKTKHFWNLVNLDGNWYHFDASPPRNQWPYVAFLRIDSEIETYSSTREGYYKFDHSTVPSTPTTPFVFDRDTYFYGH